MVAGVMFEGLLCTSLRRSWRPIAHGFTAPAPPGQARLRCSNKQPVVSQQKPSSYPCCVSNAGGQESLFTQMLGYSSSWLLHYMHISKIPGKVRSPVSHIVAHKAWITNILAATVNHMVRANLKGKSNLIVLRRAGRRTTA